MQSLMMLQPDFVLQNRVGGAQPLASYIESLNTAAESDLLKLATPTPASGFVVVAVRPGGATKVWLDLSPALPPSVDAHLRSTLGAVAPFRAKNGVVVFAINVSIWNAAPSTKQWPRPTEWVEATEHLTGPIEIGDLVNRVWPAKPGT